MPSSNEQSVQIPLDSTTSPSGSLHIPGSAQGLVLFAHGSGRGDIAQGIDMLPKCYRKPVLELFFLTYLQSKKK